MYKVIAKFRDLLDPEGRVYDVGDVYPVDGREVPEDRLAELAGSRNKAGYPLIKKVPDKKRVKELSSKANKNGAPLIKAVAEEKEEE